MTESRYKIEYVQPEPVKEKSFKLLGAFGYLWLALLASVLTYGLVYKHISTNEIISYFQKFKTEVANTEISDITNTSIQTEEILPEESVISEENIVTEVVGIPKQSKSQNEILEDTVETQKLVSEVISDNEYNNEDDNELPEDVVFESESIELEPTSNHTQQQLDTESIVNEIIKEQEKQKATNAVTATLDTTETAKTIENAITAIENEIVKTESTIETKPKITEAIKEEVIVTKEVTAVANEDVVIEELKETETETLTKQQPVQIQKVVKIEEKPAMPISAMPIKEEKEGLIQTENQPNTTLSEIANIADQTVKKNSLEKVTTEEIKPSEKTIDSSTKKPDTSAVDAIIAAMNADKAAKEKTPLISREKNQSEVNQLLKNDDNIQSTTNQLNY